MNKHKQYQQIPLNLTLPVSYAAENYVIDAQNTPIVTLVNQFPNWINRWVWVEGEIGSGKTHLAHMFQHKMQATQIFTFHDHLEHIQEQLEQSPLFVFDDNIPQDSKYQEKLFHMINMVNGRQGYGVILSEFIMDETLILPDLLSRLRQMMHFRLRPPDDALMRALLVKLFADRQLNLSLSQLNWLIPRMRRSYDFIRNFTANVDTASLSTQKGITQPLLRSVLDQMLEQQ